MILMSMIRRKTLKLLRLIHCEGELQGIPMTALLAHLETVVIITEISSRENQNVPRQNLNLGKLELTPRWNTSLSRFPPNSLQVVHLR